MTIWPPSKIGMGSKLTNPIPVEMTATKDNKAKSPELMESETAWAIPIGPERCLGSTWPLTIPFIPLKDAIITPTVASAPKIKAFKTFGVSLGG